MKNLDLIAEELFNKIRGRFPSVTLGDGDGKVTNKPVEARYYDFDYTEGDTPLGRVSISLTDNAVEVMYSNDFVANEDVITRENWYNFLKELRTFSKKRMLNFDTRNINKSNLDQRDYKFLATNRTGDGTMTESKMYGTSKTSYQNVGEARIAIKHSKPVNTESVTGRIQNISAIYIESADGERFKYPFKHLNGARAMARHVAEGGKPYDDFGSHITGLSEELNSLKKFKSYMNRSSVMAEGLSSYVLPVNERLEEIKKTISSLQKESSYRTTFESFEKPVFEDVPEDVAENWIDQLTIRQFNEELKDVFPFVYRLVSEATLAKVVTAADLLGEGPAVTEPTGDAEDYPEVDFNPRAGHMDQPMHPQNAGLTSDNQGESYIVQTGDTVYGIAKRYGISVDDIIEVNGLDDNAAIQVGQELIIPLVGEDSMSRAYEAAIEEMMGQFAEGDKDTDEGNAFSKALAKAKANNDDEMEVDGEKIPVTEFVLSMYDRETGQFPKGETAVLTAVEKDYGEQYINPAKSFIEAINAKFEEYNGYKDPELMDDNNLDNLIKTGVSGSYDFIAKSIKDFEDLIRNNPNHPKVPQVKAELAKLKPQLAQARKDSGMGESNIEEDLSQNYASDAEAIQGLMAKSARTPAETSYLTMLARKYDFYGKPENIPAAIEKATKAAEKQPGGVDGQGAKLSRTGGTGSTKPYTPKDFPSMAAAMAKVDYYEPGGRISISGVPHVRDVDANGKKFFRPIQGKAPAQGAAPTPAPAQSATPAPAQSAGTPSGRLDTKGQTPSRESVELDRIKGLAGL